jgi:hypothetical protein
MIIYEIVAELDRDPPVYASHLTGMSSIHHHTQLYIG